MRLLEVSPNARSVHYQCVHCKKKLRAPAGTPDAPRALELWDQLARLVEEHDRLARSGPAEWAVEFDTPAAPLPYEQTTRTPIPEAVRTEVWRRDGGCCVRCGAKANLQYDHIIPVSRGGATTAKNLQLLCEPCNRAKSDRV
jgi:DNA-directed RNA polymerase subunit RPC12/RpoP